METLTGVSLANTQYDTKTHLWRVNHLLKAQRALLRDPTARTQVTHGGSGCSSGGCGDGGDIGITGPGDSTEQQHSAQHSGLSGELGMSKRAGVERTA